MTHCLILPCAVRSTACWKDPLEQNNRQSQSLQNQQTEEQEGDENGVAKYPPGKLQVFPPARQKIGSNATSHEKGRQGKQQAQKKHGG